ncbi:MAG: hypothetical protein JW746_05565 [Candidatus Krumholzibacteriota bacterium]|nr:hypothetical protein [Candidatus Krumholzibacteriota bacterium]
MRIYISSDNGHRDRERRQPGRAALLLSILVAFCLHISSFPLYADSLTVSGDPGILVINSVTAGSQPTSVTDATTTYSVVTTPAQMRITGELNSSMPPNVNLRITLQAPAGGTSSGSVQLTTTAKDLITGMVHHTNQGGLSITYEFSATVGAGVISSSSRTVTLTLTTLN